MSTTSNRIPRPTAGRLRRAGLALAATALAAIVLAAAAKASELPADAPGTPPAGSAAQVHGPGAFADALEGRGLAARVDRRPAALAWRTGDDPSVRSA